MDDGKPAVSMTRRLLVSLLGRLPFARRAKYANAVSQHASRLVVYSPLDGFGMTFTDYEAAERHYRDLEAKGARPQWALVTPKERP